MPVPRLVVLPIPYIIASYALYQLGFAFEKPAWYRKHLADQYTKVWKARVDEEAGLPAAADEPVIPFSLAPYLYPPPPLHPPQAKQKHHD